MKLKPGNCKVGIIFDAGPCSRCASASGHFDSSWAPSGASPTRWSRRRPQPRPPTGSRTAKAAASRSSTDSSTRSRSPKSFTFLIITRAGERTWDLLVFVYFLSQAAPQTTWILHPLAGCLEICLAATWRGGWGFNSNFRQCVKKYKLGKSIINLPTKIARIADM